MHLLVYGSGGFGKEVVDIALRINQMSSRWAGIAFVDDFQSPGTKYGTEVMRLDVALGRFGLSESELVVAIGEPAVREKIFDALKEKKVRFANIIDPSAIVSGTASLGEGVIVTSFCSIASSAVIGDNVVLNAKAIVGHDVVIGRSTVLSSMVNIGGACRLGSCSYVGMAAQVKQGLTIGDRTIIGMGSMVHDSVGDNLIAIGNPARPLRRNIDNVVFR